VTGRKKRPWAEQPLPLGGVIVAGAILLWVWASSGREPEGCYRINEGTYLAVADGKVRLVGKQSEEASIMNVDKVRGFVVKLDKNLVYDPEGPFEMRFKEAGNPPGSQNLFIDERHGKPAGIVFHGDDGQTMLFPEIACDRLPQG
jgi:hypothetical protein